jgi:hypothetical protein
MAPSSPELKFEKQLLTVLPAAAVGKPRCTHPVSPESINGSAPMPLDKRTDSPPLLECNVEMMPKIFATLSSQLLIRFCTFGGTKTDSSM